MNFSVILDKNYIARFKTLLNSLSRYSTSYTFYVISLDDETYSTFSKVKNCIPIKVSVILEYYPELKQLEYERDRVSFIFTLSPYFPSYILEINNHLKYICTLDVDQYFFSSPKPIFDLLERYSVLITPHSFSKRLLEANFNVYGKYNVSFQVFKRDEIGLNCLKLWREQCYNWCKDVAEEGLYAEQKYLDSWIMIFGENIYEIQNTFTFCFNINSI